MFDQVRALLLCAASLALVAPAATGESFDLRIEPRESQLLPTAGNFVAPESLSLIEGTNTLLVTGISPTGSSSTEASFRVEVWRLDDGKATRLDTDFSGDVLQSCVLRAAQEALCVFVSATGELVTRVLALTHNTWRDRKLIAATHAVRVIGSATTGDSGMLVWGSSSTLPFAILLGGDSEVKWSLRWSGAGVGEFYDGKHEAPQTRLLARRRNETGSPVNEPILVSVGEHGEVLEAQRLEMRNGEAFAVLAADPTRRSGSADGHAGAPATQPRLVSYLDGGLPGAMGNPIWAHLGDRRVAYLDLMGMQPVLVVQEIRKDVSARAPLSGLPFSARITGIHDQVYVLTKDFTREEPARQVLRVSRFELVSSR